MFACLVACLFVCLSVCLSVCLVRGDNFALFEQFAGFRMEDSVDVPMCPLVLKRSKGQDFTGECFNGETHLQMCFSIAKGIRFTDSSFIKENWPVTIPAGCCHLLG